MARVFRRSVVALVALAAIAFGGVCVYMRVNEKSYVYEPLAAGGHVVAPMPESLHLAVTHISLASADGARLAGIVVPAADTAAQWLLYFHGKTGNLMSFELPSFYAGWHALGLNIATIDYRGYGNSEVRTLEERDLYADGRALYDWLVHTQHVPPGRIVIYGHSFGAAIAIELATHVEAAGLITEGAYRSVADLGAQRYPWLPVRWLVTQRFANIDKIDKVAMPKLIMHASDDTVVPYAHGQALYAAASAPKEWTELKGGHMRAFLDDSAHFWGHVAGFAQRLRNELPASESPPPGRQE